MKTSHYAASPQARTGHDLQLAKMADPEPEAADLATSWPRFVMSELLYLALALAIWGVQSHAKRSNPDLVMKTDDMDEVRVITRNNKVPLITLADVAGLGSVGEELAEIVDFLRFPYRYRDVGARIPRGILLMGPPGVGKTMTARALAGETSLPFLATSGPEFVEVYGGLGVARVRRLFRKARKLAPCIVFIDEIDAVGRARNGPSDPGHEEHEQTLNQLLVELDGIRARDNIMVVAATNRPDILDPALTRPGRFDRKIILELPGLAEREAILRVLARGKPLADDVDLRKLAEMTVGFSGADLANLLNEGAIRAAITGEKEITAVHCRWALQKLTLKSARKPTSSPEVLERLAQHQAGHVVAAECFGRHKFRYATSLAKDSGFMLFSDDSGLLTRGRLLAEVGVFLAGLVAEELAYGEHSTWCRPDLRKATDLARDMVVRYGMSRLGLRTTSDQTSKSWQADVDKEVRAIIHHCHPRMLKCLEANRKAIKRVAAELRFHDVFDQETFESSFETKSGALMLQTGHCSTPQERI